MPTILKRYPLSLLIIAVVTYLSFFRAPSTDLDNIPNIDKVVHVCMYFGMSVVPWFEFLRGHRKGKASLWHAIIGASLCPLIYGGLVEIVQGCATDYRSGDWLDFYADAAGVLLATLFALFVMRRYLWNDSKK